MLTEYIRADSALSGVFSNIADGQRLETSDGGASFIVNYGAGSPYGADNLVLSDPNRRGARAFGNRSYLPWRFRRFCADRPEF